MATLYKQTIRVRESEGFTTGEYDATIEYNLDYDTDRIVQVDNWDIYVFQGTFQFLNLQILKLLELINKISDKGSND